MEKAKTNKYNYKLHKVMIKLKKKAIQSPNNLYLLENKDK